MHTMQVKVATHTITQTFQHMDSEGRLVNTVENYEFINIIKHLVQEKKDLQERLDVMEEILHSYLPVIEKEKE